jgi:hypothetical protein
MHTENSLNLVYDSRVRNRASALIIADNSLSLIDSLRKLLLRHSCSSSCSLHGHLEVVPDIRCSDDLVRIRQLSKIGWSSVLSVRLALTNAFNSLTTSLCLIDRSSSSSTSSPILSEPDYIPILMLHFFYIPELSDLLFVLSISIKRALIRIGFAQTHRIYPERELLKTAIRPSSRLRQNFDNIWGRAEFC